MAVLLAGVGLGWVLFGAAASARRPLGWALAGAVVAAILEPVVAQAARWMPRLLAVLAVFLVLGTAVGGVLVGVLQDLDDQAQRLKEAAPQAAAELEDSGGLLGEAAADIDLEARIQRAVEQFEQPSSGVAAGAATSAGAWFVGAVLTVFLLSWGPRLARAGLQQIADDGTRARTSAILTEAVPTGRRYLLGTLSLAIAAGIVAWAVCDLEGVPAPLAVGVAVAAGSVVPGVGIVVGAVPAILLELGLGTMAGALRLLAVFVVAQAAHELVLRRVVAARSIVVGPAVVVVALVLGFDVYGIGGAYYGAALAVFGVAALEAVGRSAEADRAARLRPTS